MSDDDVFPLDPIVPSEFITVHDDCVELRDGGDGFYPISFESRAELDAFVDYLKAAGDKVWGGRDA